MRLRYHFLLVSLMAVVLASACSNSSPTKKLVLLHTSDEHSFLLGVGPEVDNYPPPTVAGAGKIEGGIGPRSTILSQERAAALAEGAAVLTVSSGDMEMGTLSMTTELSLAPDFRAMKKLGYDVVVFGNHDFELSPDYLAATVQKAMSMDDGGMPTVVMTNIHFSTTGSGDSNLKALYDATGNNPDLPIHKYWVVTTTNGLKVGFIGVMGPQAAYVAPGKSPVTFSGPPTCDTTDFACQERIMINELQPVVNKLRNIERVDLVIALAHAGTNLDPSMRTSAESYKIAEQVSGIDVVLSGHTHLVYPAVQDGGVWTPDEVLIPGSSKAIPLSEPGWRGENVAKIVINYDTKTGTVTLDKASSAMIPVRDSTPADPEMLPLINQVIGALENSSAGPSYLTMVLSEIMWPGIYDPTTQHKTLGDQYYYKLGSTSFVVPTEMYKETASLRLSADSMLLEAEEVLGKNIDLSITAYGITRDQIWVGYDGVISFADAFRIHPLGISPITHATPGFPLTYFAVPAIMVRAMLDITADAYGSPDAADTFLIPSGLCFWYDLSRPAFDPSDPFNANKGRVTTITIAPDHTNLNSCDTPTHTPPDFGGNTLFEIGNPFSVAGGWLLDPTTPLTAVTDYYLTLFAEDHGLTLMDPSNPLKTITPEEAVVYYPLLGGQELKTFVAVSRHVKELCDNNTAKPGYLPDIYNEGNSLGESPKRAFCSNDGGTCN